jgi:hypothetical protein
MEQPGNWSDILYQIFVLAAFTFGGTPDRMLKV